MSGVLEGIMTALGSSAGAASTAGATAAGTAGAGAAGAAGSALPSILGSAATPAASLSVPAGIGMGGTFVEPTLAASGSVGTTGMFGTQGAGDALAKLGSLFGNLNARDAMKAAELMQSRNKQQLQPPSPIQLPSRGGGAMPSPVALQLLALLQQRRGRGGF